MRITLVLKDANSELKNMRLEKNKTKEYLK